MSTPRTSCGTPILPLYRAKADGKARYAIFDLHLRERP